MKILSKPKGNAEEYGRWSVNPYKGCPHGCQYCYLKKGAWKKGLGGSKPTLKEHIINEDHAYHVAMAEIIENREQIIKDGGLFMTFTSDPCIPETCNLFFKIAKSAMNYHINVTMLTKDADFCGYKNPAVQYITTVFQVSSWLTNIEMFETYKERLAIGWTLTGHDELEPNASPNAERIKAMQHLKGRGYITWASIEPVIDFPSSYDMIKKALDAGCTHFKIGLLTNNTKVCRRKYDHAECLSFIQDVMNATRDRATVYWKQSFRDFIGGTKKHRLFTDEELHKILDDYPNAVGKDWNIFSHG